MKKYVVGIDLGTSSVKLFVSGGDTAPVRAEYADADFESGVRAALKQLYRSVSPEEIASVGFSGQTGTYLVVRDGQVCHSVYWHEPGRESALARTMEMFGEADWIRMTGMRHPHLASYPVPTILHFRESGIPDGLIMQPKDYVIRLLTGEFVSDCGSWRGLVHPKTGRYEPELLRALDVDASALPRMEKMARVSAEGTARFGLPEGTPVYVGHNDFYSALYGIGADNTGDAFDVTGTSEHFGVVTDGLGEKGLTESPYLNGKYVRYGVTGSGGPSLLWGAKNFGPMPEEPVRDAPVFLPYLRGERQIDADPCARGVFMGISERTDSRALSYSVAEGAAFSIFRMYERLGRPEFRRILATGGATAFPLLNRLKASLFGCPLIVKKPDCGSALGAVRAAGGTWKGGEECFLPEKGTGDFLQERYRMYRRMYDAWKFASADVDPQRLFGGDDLK